MIQVLAGSSPVMDPLMKKQIHNPLELDELEKKDKNDNKVIKIEKLIEWPTKKDDDLPNILYRRKHEPMKIRI